MASLAGAGIVSSLAKVFARVESSWSGDKARSEDGKGGDGEWLEGAAGTTGWWSLEKEGLKFLLATL